MTAIPHVVVTRFSMKLSTHADPFPDGWLARRVTLLREFCVPSMAQQTCPDFTWLLLCDVTTDADILAELRGLVAEVPQLNVAVVDGARNWRDKLQEIVDPEAEVIMTTRLDSDDALNVDAVGVLQEYGRLFAPSDLETLVVNFERGWQLDVATGAVSERWYPHSPFLTLIERRVPGRGVRGAMHAGHTVMPYNHTTHQELSIVGWLQVIHGGNVANNIVDAGLDVPSRDLRQFGLAR
jgi:hypothetical protein